MDNKKSDSKDKAPKIDKEKREHFLNSTSSTELNLKLHLGIL